MSVHLPRFPSFPNMAPDIVSRQIQSLSFLPFGFLKIFDFLSFPLIRLTVPLLAVGPFFGLRCLPFIGSSCTIWNHGWSTPLIKIVGLVWWFWVSLAWLRAVIQSLWFLTFGTFHPRPHWTTRLQPGAVQASAASLCLLALAGLKNHKTKVCSHAFTLKRCFLTWLIAANLYPLEAASRKHYSPQPK